MESYGELNFIYTIMYLTFESYIKHSDEIVKNHPLLNFSKELEDTLKNILDSKILIRRYFTDNGNVYIHFYYKNNKLFSITFSILNNTVFIRIDEYKVDGWLKIDINISSIKYILEVIKKTCISYKSICEISLNDIYKIIENIKIYNTLNKYNL